MNRSLLIAAMVLSVGCGPFFQSVTTPPPGKLASLNDGSEEIRLSRGVALAFNCWNDAGNPCENATAVVENAGVASVSPAHIDRLSKSYYMGQGPQPHTGFVVVGLTAGTTRLQVRSDDGDETFAVTVSE